MKKSKVIGFRVDSTVYEEIVALCAACDFKNYGEYFTALHKQFVRLCRERNERDSKADDETLEDEITSMFNNLADTDAPQYGGRTKARQIHSQDV